MTYSGKLNHACVRVLIDSGAMGNFISQQTADRFSFARHDVPNIPITFANGAIGACNKAVLSAYLCLENHEETIDLRVVSLPHHDIILGKPWLEKWNPVINWQIHQLTFPRKLDLIDSLLVKKLDPAARLPERKTPQAAGYVLAPAQECHLAPGEQRLITTGLALVVPEGHYGQLHPRSSLAKKGIVVEAGVIDADYRGPIQILLHNQSTEPFTFNPADNPLAQIVLVKISTPQSKRSQNSRKPAEKEDLGPLTSPSYQAWNSRKQ